MQRCNIHWQCVVTDNGIVRFLFVDYQSTHHKVRWMKFERRKESGITNPLIKQNTILCYETNQSGRMKDDRPWCEPLECID